MKRQLVNYFVVPEILNKVFIRPTKVKDKENTQNCQFIFHDVRLIKNIIAQELLGAKRSKMNVVILKKVITVNLKNNVANELLVFLQKKPIVWSDKLYSTSRVSDNFFNGVFIVKNNKLELVMVNKGITKFDLMVKSAYFD